MMLPMLCSYSSTAGGDEDVHSGYASLQEQDVRIQSLVYCLQHCNVTFLPCECVFNYISTRQASNSVNTTFFKKT